MLFPNHVSPLEITMALHYRTIATPYAAHEPEHRRSPAVARIHQLFLARGYIVHATPENREQYGAEYEATEALHTWADALCAVPRPRQRVVWECKGCRQAGSGPVHLHGDRADWRAEADGG